jgi:phosphoglycolate phosphatase
MRYRLIVWDFDGTLADTLALSVQTFNALAGRHGFRPLDDLDAVRSLNTKAFFRYHKIPLWKLPMLAAEYRAAVGAHMASVRLFAGLAEVLRGLRGAGFRQGVLSSNTAENVRACLEANAAGEAFDFVVGYPRLFGKATAIRRLLRRQAVGPREFLYVGDELRDVEAARKAGVDVAAVAWGYHAPEVLARQTPTYFWKSPDDALASLTVNSPS